MEQFVVSLHIDRCPDQPENPEAIGEPVEIARFDSEETATQFVHRLAMRKILMRGW